MMIVNKKIKFYLASGSSFLNTLKIKIWIKNELPYTDIHNQQSSTSSKHPYDWTFDKLNKYPSSRKWSTHCCYRSNCCNPMTRRHAILPIQFSGMFNIVLATADFARQTICIHWALRVKKLYALTNKIH